MEFSLVQVMEEVQFELEEVNESTGVVHGSQNRGVFFSVANVWNRYLDYLVKARARARLRIVWAQLTPTINGELNYWIPVAQVRARAQRW